MIAVHVAIQNLLTMTGSMIDVMMIASGFFIIYAVAAFIRMYGKLTT